MNTVTVKRDYQAESDVAERFRSMGMPVDTLRVFTGDGLRCFMARENCGGKLSDPLRWHISVSGPGRVPSWDELVEVAHQLRPGVGFVLSIPPRSYWMNVHPHVLHLWEVADPPLQEEWRVNARGDAPS